MRSVCRVVCHPIERMPQKADQMRDAQVTQSNIFVLSSFLSDFSADLFKIKPLQFEIAEAEWA